VELYIGLCAGVRVCATGAHMCAFLDGSPQICCGYESQQIAWAMYFSCSSTARACASASVRVSEWLSVRSSLDGFSQNVLGTYYESLQVTWATYFSYSSNTRTCASSRVAKRRFRRIPFIFVKSILRVTTIYMDGLRARVCVRARSW
jgi:hypothetical protein